MKQLERVSYKTFLMASEFDRLCRVEAIGHVLLLEKESSTSRTHLKLGKERQRTPSEVFENCQEYRIEKYIMSHTLAQ